MYNLRFLSLPEKTEDSTLAAERIEKVEWELNVEKIVEEVSPLRGALFKRGFFDRNIKDLDKKLQIKIN